MPCRANSPSPAPTPFHASSAPSPSIPSSPALPQAPAAGCDPEGLGRGSPWGWDTAGPRGTGQHCQVPGTDLQGEGKAEGSGQVVTWPKGGSEEPAWWPSPSGSFQGRFRECWGGCGRSPQLCSHRGAVGSNNFITGTALAAGTGLGKGTGPSVPPEPPLSAASAPAHPEEPEIWLFSPFFPSFNLYPALLHREKRPLLLPSLWEEHSRGQRQLEGFPAALERTSWIQVE